MIFPKGTLRVVSPVTEDGNRPKIDPDTKQAIYKETFLPMTAKKALEEQNRRLPNHLKKSIEPLDDQPVKKAVQPAMVSEQVEVKGPVHPQRLKPGPKPKHAQAN